MLPSLFDRFGALLYRLQKGFLRCVRLPEQGANRDLVTAVIARDYVATEQLLKAGVSSQTSDTKGYDCLYHSRGDRRLERLMRLYSLPRRRAEPA